MEKVVIFTGVSRGYSVFVEDNTSEALAVMINRWLHENPKIEITRALQSGVGNQLVITIFYKTN